MSKCNGVSVLVDGRVRDLLLNFPNHVHCRLCGRVMYVDYVTVNGMKAVCKYCASDSVKVVTKFGSEV